MVARRQEQCSWWQNQEMHCRPDYLTDEASWAAVFEGWSPWINTQLLLKLHHWFQEAQKIFMVTVFHCVITTKKRDEKIFHWTRKSSEKLRKAILVFCIFISLYIFFCPVNAANSPQLAIIWPEFLFIPANAELHPPPVCLGHIQMFIPHAEHTHTHTHTHTHAHTHTHTFPSHYRDYTPHPKPQPNLNLHVVLSQFWFAIICNVYIHIVFYLPATQMHHSSFEK